jgi:murein DD-endopeptidase MepM/ murein hydrolase activator NlpD
MTPRLSLPLLRRPEDMRIVQPFGANPEVYARHGMRGHNGIDFDAEDGELVVAVDEGRVVEIRFDQTGYWTTVKLSHAWGESRYARGRVLSVPIEFHLGYTVRPGGRIFLANGHHLHLGLRLRRGAGQLDSSNDNGFGGWEDPLPYLRDALGLLPEPASKPARGKANR